MEWCSVRMLQLGLRYICWMSHEVVQRPNATVRFTVHKLDVTWSGAWYRTTGIHASHIYTLCIATHVRVVTYVMNKLRHKTEGMERSETPISLHACNSIPI